MKRNYKHLIALTFFTALTSITIAQPFNKKVKAEILGVANDTAFITKTNECLITYYSSKNQFEISIPTASFTSGDATKDSLFQLNNSSLIKITGKVSGNVFDLFSNENSNQDDILEGDLYMNNKELHISEEYHIYTSLSSQVGQKKMYLNLRFYFDPAYFEIDLDGYFANPMEFIIQGGYVNQKN
ncbi:MAG: hypothetical protein H6587_02775 [Flavobacteriales bacterium]|nr:hypothetical protein [Flavobacteriales bacterium]MCB9363471.1 hypothetical protein [Flavobacteriales bacterium]